MDLNQQLGCLEARWRKLLEDRGHYIYQKQAHVSVVRSRNTINGFRCRWLLLIGCDPKRELTRSEQAYIRQHLRQAKPYKETTYLVVGFTDEPKRIIAIPARAALKAGYIRSDKGGIAWDD